MLTQFYGTISVHSMNATIVGAAAHSNNFSVAYVDTGHTRITLNEWLAYQPCVSVTPQLFIDDEVTFACYQISKTANQYKIDVFTDITNEERADASYSFVLMCGSRRGVDLEPGEGLELTAGILPFGPDNTPVLTLSHKGSYLDKGTVLTATTEVTTKATTEATTEATTDDVAVTVSVPATVSYNGQCYALRGYTHAPGLSAPVHWYNVETGANTYQVQVPADRGVSSRYQSFQVTATAEDGTVLSSDCTASIERRGR